MVKRSMPGLCLLLALGLACQGQDCEVKNKVQPDGSFAYYVDPAIFYFTQARWLKGNVMTDGENYYLALFPFPYPARSSHAELKNDLSVKMANGAVHTLKYFDARYLDSDTAIEMIYQLDKAFLQEAGQTVIDEATISFGKGFPSGTYHFELHREALRSQLTCLKNRH